MVKKILISLNDEQTENLNRYIKWKEDLLYENAGIIYKPNATETCRQIIVDFLSNLNYGTKK